MNAFTGTWTQITSPTLDADYLSSQGAPYIRLRLRQQRLEGEYQLGPRRGHIDGRLQDQGPIVFSFEGMDGAELVNGAGLAWLQDDCLHFHLLYHFGDDVAFAARRPDDG
ncbi:MAG: hypothetical protein GKR89_30735 [Candidatus Latescibacteria bacterium]|nr:hypothetical protein [Candidatus Latescibacterota bacterium]